jgi:NAD(P)-dependent dehydrogenase (short-subunit alcohol dehydrogenase family)
MKVQGKVFFVTGAGSGIGRELVLNLAKRGAQVAAADINPETLQETIRLVGALGERISTHVVNVADRKAVEALPEQIIARHGAIDGIINNAGIIQPFVGIENLELDVMERVVDVNLWGPIYVIKAFLPYLLERPEAHIVNVSSMGGFFPFPGQTMYGASKAGLKLLTEGLYSELSDTNVRVTVVYPGAIDTNISENSGLGDAYASNADSSALKPLQAGVAAQIIIDGIEKDKYSVLVGSDAKMMDLLYRISPKRAAGLISKMMKGLMAE